MAKCKSTSKDKRLKVSKRMPPLKRKKDGEDYCYINDEVMKWISKNPALISYVLDKAAANGYIVYDPKFKVWHGADYYEIEYNED